MTSLPVDHPTYGTADIWQAAWLLSMGCHVQRVAPANRGNLWLFDNPGDRAFDLGREFRAEGVATFPVLEAAPLLPPRRYRLAAPLANEARKGLASHDHTHA